jgi:hypothetical protein
MVRGYIEKIAEMGIWKWIEYWAGINIENRHQEAVGHLYVGLM